MKHRGYWTGTLVQRRDGYVFIKTDNGMVAEHRWVAASKMLHRALREGEVVLRRQPKRDDNRPENLVIVQHALTKYVMLPRARVIYVPKDAPKKDKI